MPKTDNEEIAAVLDGEMFLEDVEKNFDWRSIPLEGWACIPIFWFLAGVVFWQFFTRYALDSAAVWTEEVARQLLILLTFFGAAYALRTRAHISINYFALQLPGRVQRVLKDFVGLLQLAFYGYSLILCLKIAEATQFQMLMAVDLSKSVVYLAVAASFGIMTLRCALDLFQSFRAPRNGANRASSSLPGDATVAKAQGGER